MGGRRESVGRLTARTQSSSGPAGQQMVSVAVLPPRLPPGLAPPTGVGAADTFDWDESLNWRHNEPINEAPITKKKQILRNIGLTTYRKPIDEDLPPFMLRQVPYDTWRKHYAKDKDGNYHGTHAPAEDCLLKPEDVAKWRLGPPKTKADRWTRGTDALPVYAEVKEEGMAPEYEADYTGPPRTEPVLDDDGEMKKIETNPSISSASTAGPSARVASDASSVENSAASALAPAYTPAPEVISITPSEPSQGRTRWGMKKKAYPASGEIVRDGKTAQQIIAEKKAALEKDKPKMTLKERVQRAAEITMMGN